MTQPITVIAVPIWDTENGHRFDPNQSYYTMNFVEQMRQLDSDGWLCVLVDNGSDSEYTRQYLDNIDDPRFHVIRNETNLGYGAAANQGVEYGLKRGANYVVVSNNDVLFYDNNWIENAFLVHLREHPNWLMGARYISENTMCELNGQIIPYLEGYLLAMTALTWIDLGGFDPKFMAYMEDVDLSYRAVQRGYGLIQSPQFVWAAEGGLMNARPMSVPVHHIGGRTGYNRSDFDFPTVTRQSIEYFQQKHAAVVTHK